jgi:hypothetical protein
MAEFFIEIDAVKGRTERVCNKCNASIPKTGKYLYMRRNRHNFILCGKCLYIFAAKIVKDDPLVSSYVADAMLEGEHFQDNTVNS